MCHFLIVPSVIKLVNNGVCGLGSCAVSVPSACPMPWWPRWQLGGRAGTDCRGWRGTSGARLGSAGCAAHRPPVTGHGQHRAPAPFPRGDTWRPGLRAGKGRRKLLEGVRLASRARRPLLAQGAVLLTKQPTWSGGRPCSVPQAGWFRGWDFVSMHIEKSSWEWLS